MIARHRFLPVLLLLLLALGCFVLLEWLGGATYSLDVAAIRASGPWRAAHPEAGQLLVLYTHLGSAPALLLATAAAGWWLWRRGERRRVAGLVVAALGTRVAVEIIKLAVDRARPSFDPHPVVVHSQSFPSGHAANSMATFLALALLVVPERWRSTAVAAALTASLAMGATRPLLGVHWPSDVVAGWILGASAALLAWWWVNLRSDQNAA